jgi:hypothetical protein
MAIKKDEFLCKNKLKTIKKDLFLSILGQKAAIFSQKSR